MSKVVTTTVLPDVAGGSVTLGGSGDNVVVTGNDFRTNTYQDAGGNAAFTSDGSGTLSGMNSAFGGALNLVSTQTASNTAEVVFGSSLITSTYDVYLFKFIQCNPATNSATWQFQMAHGDGDYNTVMTTNFYRALHSEDDTTIAQLAYDTGNDQAQGTAFQYLAQNVMNDADACISGELYLFAPLSTTFIKQFSSRCTAMRTGPLASDVFVSGHFNTTGALPQIKFAFSSGNFDGTIKLYGFSKS